MKFSMLYSCGKDSALALHRMLSAGHEAVSLIVTYNTQEDRSWFHGVTPVMLDAVEASLGIPLIRCGCSPEDYEAQVERCLAEAYNMGARAAVFGDIDIEGHLEWNRARCDKTGLECVAPLWQESREALVYEMIDAGFRTAVKCVDLRALDESFLGQTLDRALAERIAATGADICGENGEYHTFVYDGPTFRQPIPIRFGEKVSTETHAAIDILLER